ncbi:MAG: type III pantothenate kinase [Verrucomicrobiota bacterium]|nr:type III pantothenate kinase [Verrucomicrobiota bacterium]
MPRAEFLLIDISNSYTKFALSDRETLGKVSRIATRELTADRFKRAIRGQHFEEAIVSSVVPARLKAIRAALAGKARILQVSSKFNLGVGIDYPNPGKIGADRLANAASVVALYGAPSVVVDFGTAVTFDIISAGKKYIGGVIAPGLEVMTDYLFQRTALLPKIKLIEPVSAIGKSTRNAMQAGAVYGYRGLVREIIAQIRREISGKPKVIATGGYAELIAHDLPEIEIVHPNLTLEGLRIIGSLNIPS